MAHRKASDDELLASYARTSSVWATGQEFGMCGQSVHDRLVRLGATNPPNLFTEADDERLRRDYNTYVRAGRLSDLAAEMGRTRQFLCRQARRLGLTSLSRKKAPSVVRKMSERFKQWHQDNPHPRGMSGKKHDAKARAKMSRGNKIAQRAMSEDAIAARTEKSMKTKIERYGTVAGPRPGASWKAGWRVIGGQRRYFRSQWEANYAYYLEWLRLSGKITKWEHEPETFWFEEIRRGVRSYLPDFRVTYSDGRVEYHEVKGWMDDRSNTKIKRMRKYYPNTTLKVISAKAYKVLSARWSDKVPGWEDKSAPRPPALNMPDWLG